MPFQRPFIFSFGIAFRLVSFLAETINFEFQEDIEETENITGDTYQPLNLLIHRATLMKDLIEAFSDPKILSSLVLIKVKDNNGRTEAGEGTGVLRDVLTEFWFQFFQSLAIGAGSKVPVIRHDYQKREWKAIGRLLLYTAIVKKASFPFPCRKPLFSVAFWAKKAFQMKCC